MKGAYHEVREVKTKTGKSVTVFVPKSPPTRSRERRNLFVDLFKWLFRI